MFSFLKFPVTAFRRVFRNSLLYVLVGLLGFGVVVSAFAQDEGWPEFRGPLGNGIVVSPEVNLPVHFGEEENVTWKREIPFQGWSTPVILDEQIWLTTATTDGQRFFVLCVDATTGDILFNQQLFESENPEPLGNEVNSYASPSPVIEPGRIFVHFGSYGTACLDTGTFEVLWERRDLPCRHFRGPGSSAFVFENLLVLTFDGADVQYLAALNKATGETVWKTDRSTDWPDLDENGQPKLEGDFRKAFTTPIVITPGEVPLLISPSSFSAFAYNALTGEELWHTRNESYSPAVRPVYGDGLLYITTGRGRVKELWALRPDGKGDVTESHVAWKLTGRLVPDEPSPLLVDGLLYLLSNDGFITCLESATGTELWSERLGGNYMASPIYAGGRIYCLSVQGRVCVVKAGRAYELLATNNFDTGFMASPAVYGNALFLRSKTHLYRIEMAPSP